MTWFRSKRGGIAWLACFALVCHFALSFGHIHVGQTSTKSIISSFLPGGTTSDDPGQPSRKNPSGLADDYCAICSNISLASTLVIPIVAAIGILFYAFVPLPWPATEAELTGFPQLRFQARGPPQA
jgi:hypothetical protein